MLQIIVEIGVYLEDTEEVFKCQGVGIGAHILCKRLHYGGGTEGEVLHHRQEEDHLNEEGGKRRTKKKTRID